MKVSQNVHFSKFLRDRAWERNPLYRGSVQKLYSLPDAEDLLVSETTQGGSVFDVGTLFHLPGNDVARSCIRHAIYQKLADPKQWQELADVERYSFLHNNDQIANLLEELKSHGAKTHHLGMIDGDGKVWCDSFPPVPTNVNLIRKFKIIKPKQYLWQGNRFYDYSCYANLDNFVVPIEYIVRFGITSGSSILKKYNALDDNGRRIYLNELGIDRLVPWDKWSAPRTDCTTKYESIDRSLSGQESSIISTLNGDDFCRSLALVVLASTLVDWLVGQIGLEVWDMKWELARSGDSQLLVDTIDTDSMRITMQAQVDNASYTVHYSKQAMRDYYQIFHYDWLVAVNECKLREVQEGKPFVELLAKGQQTGTYPSNPHIDPEFLSIQEKKMQLIQDSICFSKHFDLRKIYQTAYSEVDYYLSKSGRDRLAVKKYQKLSIRLV